MPTGVIAAVLNKIESLSGSLFPGGTRPPVYFGSAALAASGAQVRVPYLVVRDDGAETEFFADSGGLEMTAVAVDCFAQTLADADAIAAAVKWGGQAPANKAGLDWGALALTAPRYAISVRPVRSARSLAGYDRDGARAHLVTLTYRVVTGLDATAAPA